MRRLMIGLVVFVLAGTAACSDDVSVGRDTKAKPDKSAKPAVAADGFIACGHLEYRGSERNLALENPAKPEITCMRQALKDRRTAEVTVTYPTVEGDPIHQTYRLGTDRRVSKVIDSREDTFGGSGSGIHRVACTKPEWLHGVTCPPRPPSPFAPASWTLDTSRSRINDSTTSFIVIVRRVGCASGRIGKVLPPRVDHKVHSVTVTFNVQRLPGKPVRCQGIAVPYRVDLGQPLNRRIVVDGQCLMPRSCAFGELPWQ